MLKKNNYLFLLCLLLIGLFSACKKGQYKTMFTEAKASEIQEDSLLLGIRFGISQDSFFNYCQVLNQERKIFDSNSRLRIARRINWKYEKFQMNFYPTYILDRLHRLEFECIHEAYAPWNKQYFSEKIIHNISHYFEEEFQIKMKEFNHEKFGKAFLNFTGNRRLRLYIKNQKTVAGEFLDMTNEFEK